MPAVTTAIQKPGSIPRVRRRFTNTGLSAMSGIRLSNLQTSLRIQGSWNRIVLFWWMRDSLVPAYLQTQAAQHPLNLLQLWGVLPDLVDLPVRNLIGHLATTHYCIWRQDSDLSWYGKYRNSSSFLISQTTRSCHVWVLAGRKVYRLYHVTSNQSSRYRHLVLLLLLLLVWYHIGRHFHSFLS